MDELSHLAFLHPTPSELRSGRPSRAIGLLTLLLAGAANGQSFTITFDPGDAINGLPVGTVLANQYAASTGATFSPNAFSGSGGPTGDWATNSDVTVVSSTGADVGGLGVPPAGTAPVSGNLLRSFSGWLDETGDPSILIEFSVPVQACAATFAGIATAEDVRLFAYDATDALVDEAVATGTGQQRIAVSAASISSIAIQPGSFDDWVGVDDISCVGDEILTDGFE